MAKVKKIRIKVKKYVGNVLRASRGASNMMGQDSIRLYNEEDQGAGFFTSEDFKRLFGRLPGFNTEQYYRFTLEPVDGFDKKKGKSNVETTAKKNDETFGI